MAPSRTSSVSHKGSIVIGNHNLQMYGLLPVRVADVARCANVRSCGAGSLGVWIRMLTAVAHSSKPSPGGSSSGLPRVLPAPDAQGA